MREHLLADLPEGCDDPPVILSNRSRTSRDDRFRRKAITPLLSRYVPAWDEL